MIPPQALLNIDAGNKTLRSSPSKDDVTRTEILLVTGPRSVRSLRPPETAAGVPRAKLDRAHQQGWQQWGEAGRPLKPEERRGYVGPEEHLVSDPRVQRREP